MEELCCNRIFEDLSEELPKPKRKKRTHVLLTKLLDQEEDIFAILMEEYNNTVKPIEKVIEIIKPPEKIKKPKVEKPRVKREPRSKPRLVYSEQLPFSNKDLMDAIALFKQTDLRQDQETVFKIFTVLYDKQIENTIKKMAYTLDFHSVQDLKAAVYERIFIKKVLFTYDPSKSALKTFVWYVVNTIVRNSYQKLKKDPTCIGVSFTSYVENSFEDIYNCFDYLEDTKSEEQINSFILDEAIHEFESRLKEAFSMDPDVYNKDAEIFRAICELYTVKEISLKVNQPLSQVRSTANSLRKTFIEFLGYQNNGGEINAYAEIKNPHAHGGK